MGTEPEAEGDADAEGAFGGELDDEPIVELDPGEALAFLSRADGVNAEPDAEPDAERSIGEDGVEGADGPAVRRGVTLPGEEPMVSPSSGDAEEDHQDVVAEAVAAAKKAYESTESVELDHEAPRIPGYRIEGVIGRGATGIVYRARQLAVDRAIALKVMHPELITNRRAVRRLKREARLAAKLAHPSIISAIDMGSINGVWWYAMELVEGIPLSRRIKERTQLSERECLRLFSPLCDALQHAHEVGVVHRDIKPANILLDHRGRARLVDLGLAMGQNDPSITKTGSTLGTPHYVSPEQARDPSAADIRSDIWSVGATLYHAVCGHPPFHSEDEEEGGVAEILSRVLYEPIVDPREFAPNLSRGFALMMRKCLTRDPDKRYQEPWEMVADIELLRERRRLDLSGSQLDAYASRRPQWVRPVAAVLGLVGLVAITWAATARPWEERLAPQQTERRATYADWPELDAIHTAFDAGTMSLAEAQAELSAPSLQTIDPSLDFLKNELVVKVKEALDQQIQHFMDDTTGLIDAALAERRFVDASGLIDSEFADRLTAATGYASIGELPRGKTEHRARNWRNDESERVAAALQSAIQSAEEELEDAYPSLVRARTEELLAEHRWRDALEWLTPPDPNAWRERLEAVVHVKGLTEAQCDAIFGTISSSLRSDRSEVRRQVALALDEARGFLVAERERWLAEIRGADQREDLNAAMGFLAAIDAKHAGLDLDLAQLPAEDADFLRARIEAARGEISREERQQRVDAAELAFEALDTDVALRIGRRAYGGALELLQRARKESWRESTYDRIDARLREVELLQSVLARAAERIAGRNGSTRELTFDWGPVRGRIQSRGGDVLRRGFRFKPDFGSSEEILVLSLEAAEALSSSDRKEARPLAPADVLRFAGLTIGSANVGPEQDLAAAAFLLAEGHPAEARGRLRLEEHAADDPLPSILEGRARRAVAQLRAKAAAEAETVAPTPGRVERESRTIEEVYGTPNQATAANDARLVWRFADDRETPRGLNRALPTGEMRAGAWTSVRHWDLTPIGYELRDTLTERADLMRDGTGPTLPLARPLNNDRKATLRVEVVPGDARPLEPLLAISIRGHHALFLDDHVWFGTGSLRDLYDHVETGSKDDFGGFVVAPCKGLKNGQSTTIMIEMATGRLPRMKQDEMRIELPKLWVEPKRDDPYVRIRSRGPMTLREVELKGQRHSGG